MKVKTAVIMAAGMGTRFGNMTEKMPKGFIPFKGKPMIVRSIETLISCGIERIIIISPKIYTNTMCIFSPLC